LQLARGSRNSGRFKGLCALGPCSWPRNTANIRDIRVSSLHAMSFADMTPASATPISPAEIQQLLVKSGITPTAQRIRVGEILFAAPQHLSAEQILATLRLCGERVSKATVYNTLNLFAERGLIKPLNLDPNRCCFDSNTAPHFHFHNVDTGELVDVCPDEVAFSRLPTLPEGTESAGLEVIIRVRARRP
jgi:Fur family iron response transcriptional regulator